MAALDLLGRRWTLRILWELRDGPLGFVELQERCDGMSSSVLSERLRDLRSAKLLTREGERDAPTALGRELHSALAPLDAWAGRWASSVHPA